MSRFAFLSFLILFPGIVSLNAQAPDTLQVAPKRSTAPAQSFADDPAVWVHPTDLPKSLILGTDKGTFPNGGIFVWNLDGTEQQRIVISHPNHIDVEYGMTVGGESVDIAVVTMRDHDELRVFRIDPQTRQLESITTEATIATTASPFGLGVYKRPSDGEIFAIISSRDPEAPNKVQQFRLHDDGVGKVAGTEVRQITNTVDLVDGIVVDDQLGYLYLAEEGAGVSKYHADPAEGDERLAFFATEDGITGNREGLAIYGCSDSTGYILLASPLDRALYVYPREGNESGPHNHPLVATIRDVNGLHGDGVEVTNRAMSEPFQDGLLVWHDTAGNRFQLYAWQEVAQALLKVCTDRGAPTSVEIGATNGPETFELEQNFPNPFNPETTIPFRLADRARVRLTVFNMRGQEVKVLLNNELAAGSYAHAWDGSDSFGNPAASGIYIYQVRSAGFSEARRMVLFR